MNVLILTQRSGVYPRRPLMSKIFLWTAYAALLYVPQRKISRIFPKINYIFKICCSCGVGCCVVIENYLRWSFRRFTLIAVRYFFNLTFLSQFLVHLIFVCSNRASGNRTHDLVPIVGRMRWCQIASRGPILNTNIFFKNSPISASFLYFPIFNRVDK